VFNKCSFPKAVQKSKAAPYCKTKKSRKEHVSKFPPICLLNTGGQVLEKVLINRINHHVYPTNSKNNNNQYGFTPQNSTTDKAIGVEDS